MVRLHTALGTATLVVLLSHVAAFLGGVAMRTGGFPFEYLVPDFTRHYCLRHVALGALALYLALLAGLSASLRRHRWFRHHWRKLHLLNYAVFGLGLWHGLAIGSETRLQPLHGLYWIFALSAVAALAVAHGGFLRRRGPTAKFNPRFGAIRDESA